MTLSPGLQLGTRLTVPPQDGHPAIELGQRCGVPGCGQPAQRGLGHHIVPRSKTGGPVDFISIDGVVFPNRMPICFQHHVDVSGDVGGHKARLLWDDHIRIFVWFERMRGVVSVGPGFTAAGTLLYVDEHGVVWFRRGPIRGVRGWDPLD